MVSKWENFELPASSEVPSFGLIHLGSLNFDISPNELIHLLYLSIHQIFIELLLCLLKQAGR